MQLKSIIWVFAAVLLFNSPIFGQGNTEKELLKTADRLFSEKKYDEAMPLYSDLVSNYPDNYHYNFAYGICILKAGKVKPRAIPFLERAAEVSITTDYVFYYLAKAYTYANRFDDAIEAFKDFKDVVNTDEAEKYLINLEISNCEYASKNIDDPPKGILIGKDEVVKDQVIDKSKIDPMCGKYILLPKKYKNKYTSAPDTKYAFLTADGQTMYFSVKQENGDFNIAKLDRKGNGQWGKAVLLPDGINTRLKERYPITGRDKNTLYFSSNGHQGYGGLDIYKISYDPDLDLWSKPENLEHPVNSVYDDYFYSVFEDEEMARFVSDRNSKTALTTYYEVSYKKDIDKSFIDISGSFLHNGKDDGSRAILRVVRQGDDVEVYATSTHPITGKYRLKLPSYGEYRIEVEKKGFEKDNRGFSLMMGTPREFAQEIILKRLSGGDQRLLVTNYYSEDAQVALNNTPVRSPNDKNQKDEISKLEDKGQVEIPSVVIDEIVIDDDLFEVEIVRPIAEEVTSSENSEETNAVSDESSLSNDDESSVEKENTMATTVVEAAPSTFEEAASTKKANPEIVEAPIVDGIIFNVQIGAYKEANERKLRSVYGAKQLDLVQFRKRDDGTLIALTGESRTYGGILRQLRAVKGKNIPDAFPVAYHNGKKISVLSAKKWLRNQK